MKRAGTVLTLAGLPLLSGCAILQRGFLAASGHVALAERHLFLIVVAVMVIVIGPVLLLAPVMAWHYRLSNKHSAYQPKWGFRWWLECLIWIPPSLIVVGLAVVLWRATIRLDPYRPLPHLGPPLRVEAVALDWKFLFIYPEQGIAAVNALVVPAGHAVSLSLTSGTVMQSLLIPRLAGQIYAMAGMTTRLNLSADAPGAYLGENTQYNGDGFQAENFTVTAMPAAGFAHWVAEVRRSGQPFDAAAYAQLFQKSVPRAPIFFTNVPARLFDRILDRTTRGGPAESANAQEATR